MSAANLLALCFLLPPTGQEATTPTNPLAAFADERTRATFATMGGIGKWREGYLRPEHVPVERTGLPNALTQDCEAWLRKVLKPEHVPSDLDSLWFGLRKAPDSDLVAATFEVENNQAAWVDRLGKLIFMVRIQAGEALTTEREVRALVEGTMTRFFNLPEDVRGTFQFGTGREKVESTTLWWGSTHWGQPHQTNGELPLYKPLVGQHWYNSIDFWTDGKTLCLEMSAEDHGKSRGQMMYARADMPPRYVPRF